MPAQFGENNTETMRDWFCRASGDEVCQRRLWFLLGKPLQVLPQRQGLSEHDLGQACHKVFRHGQGQASGFLILGDLQVDLWLRVVC